MGIAAPRGLDDDRFARRPAATLAFDPAFVARQRRRLWVTGLAFAAAAVCGVALLFALYPGIGLTPRGLRVFGPLAVLCLLAPLVMFLAARQMRRLYEEFRMHAAADGLRLVYPSGGGGTREVRAGWDNVYWDGRKLLVRDRFVAVRHPSDGDVFDRAAFDAAVLGRIRPANVVTPGRLAWLALRAGCRDSVALTLVAVLAVAALALVAARALRLL